MTPRRTLRWPVAALALLAAACQREAETLPQNCPPASIVGDVAQITQFRPGRGRDLTDVAVQAELAGLQLECLIGRREISAKLSIGVRVGIGPASADRLATLRYFVAVVDAGNNVLAREEFDLTVEFPPNVGRVERTEEVEPRIPFRDRADIAGHRIYVGFLLTPDELRYNRTRRR